MLKNRKNKDISNTTLRHMLDAATVTVFWNGATVELTSNGNELLYSILESKKTVDFKGLESVLGAYEAIGLNYTIISNKEINSVRDIIGIVRYTGEFTPESNPIRIASEFRFVLQVGDKSINLEWTGEGYIFTIDGPTNSKSEIDSIHDLIKPYLPIGKTLMYMT